MPDLRTALQEAYDKSESEEKETPGTPEVKEDDTPDVGEAGTPETPAAAAEDTGTPAEPEGDTAAPEPKEEPATSESGEQPGAQPGEGAAEVAAAEVSERIPVAWRGAARQHWGELPQPVREEVIRREREVNTVLDESASARKFVTEFNEVVQPFQSFMAADGVTPIQATQNLMRTAAALQVGNPQQKAAIATEIIRKYGVPIDVLDSMLAGETPLESVGHQQGHAAGHSEMQRYIDQRLAPVNQFMQGLQTARQQRDQETDASVESEIDTFAADPKNTYYEDVREDMADLLEMQARRGKSMSIQEAYDAALRLRPDLQSAGQPAPQSTFQQRQESLERKKLAAASVKGSVQSEPVKTTPTTRRGALEAAWSAHGGGD